MARYIKANALVAKYLDKEKERNMLGDGNYLFWQNDMLKFGSLVKLDETLAKIGGIALLPHEAREEQDGLVCRPLPVATDKRFQQATTSSKEESVESSTQEDETNEDSNE